MGDWHGICDSTNRRRRIFCSVIVPVVLVAMGKKYAIPLAVVGFVWFVIAVIMHFS